MVAVKTELEYEQAYVSILYQRLDTLRVRAADRLAQLWSAESGLCFGRLDLADGTRRYIGRLGLADDDRESLLVDWRAPAARPFYRATPADPSGVVRRRHLRPKGRIVVDFEDDVLDLDALSDDERSGLSGEAALLAALNASRTGRMGDIVATIQAEQDRIIRSDLRGILVVEGGPGTGKTAVALHRAAYLLYTHRERLARRGVLVVGPNPTFLRYIEQVLPSLGETGVLLATTDELYPGVTATATEPPETAALKVSERMAGILAAAVADRQRLPGEDLEIRFDGQVLRLDRRTCLRARLRARAAGTPHNQARAMFRRELLAAPERARLLREPPDRRAAGGAGWWRPADVPLLDEAAVLLGEKDGGAAREALQAEQWRRELAYARGVLSMVGIDEHRYGGAALLAVRQRDTGPGTGIAERARQDRTWTFGHVIVDEAQELSAMAWRTLMRRCPARSMTVSGDTAQRGAAWGVRSWADALEPHAPGAWRVEELTVNYRTPVEIIEVAADVLAAISPELRPPRSVRETGVAPWALRLDEAELGARLPEVVAGEASTIEGGKLAVLVPAERAEELGRRVAAVPGAAAERGPAALDARIAVLTVAESKGLEFDSVVLVDPAGIVAESPRGIADLYVALTRATQRLGVVHSGDLPAMLGRLREVAATGPGPGGALGRPAGPGPGGAAAALSAPRS